MCLKLLRRKPGDGGTAIPPLHTKLHSCFSGATSRSMASLLKQKPLWLPENWQDCPRFATADASVAKLREGLKALDLSLLPQDVSKKLEERRRQIAKVFRPKNSAEEDHDDD